MLIKKQNTNYLFSFAMSHRYQTRLQKKKNNAVPYTYTNQDNGSETNEEVIEYVPFRQPMEVDEIGHTMCYNSADCECEECYYNFYPVKNMIHEENSLTGEVCYGPDCNLCPYKDIHMAGHSWDDPESTDDEWENPQYTWNTPIVKTEPVNPPVKKEQMKEPTRTVSSEGVVRTLFPYSDSDEEMPELESDSDSQATEYSDELSEEDSDYVPSEGSDFSEEDEDTECEDEEIDSEEDEDTECEDILTSLLSDMYGRIYYARERLMTMMKKKWTAKRECKISNLVLPAIEGEWEKELARLNKQMGKYCVHAHVRMIDDMREMREEIIKQWNNLWRFYW